MAHDEMYFNSCIGLYQGTSDSFYIQKQLLPENFAEAAKSAGISVDLRLQEGYDHSYFFIASFISEHIGYHADSLVG